MRIDAREAKAAIPVYLIPGLIHAAELGTFVCSRVARVMLAAAGRGGRRRKADLGKDNNDQGSVYMLSGIFLCAPLVHAILRSHIP